MQSIMKVLLLISTVACAANAQMLGLPDAAGIHPAVAPFQSLAVPTLSRGILPVAAPLIAARSAISPLAAMPALASGIMPATAAGFAPIGLARTAMTQVRIHPQRTLLAAPAAAAVDAPAAMTGLNMWNQPAAAILPAAGINTLPLGGWAAHPYRK